MIAIAKTETLDKQPIISQMQAKSIYHGLPTGPALMSASHSCPIPVCQFHGRGAGLGPGRTDAGSNPGGPT